MGSVYDRSLDLKILVMGAGAVGGYFGGMLANCDEDVIFLARGSHLEAINERGLRVDFGRRRFHFCGRVGRRAWWRETFPMP